MLSENIDWFVWVQIVFNLFLVTYVMIIRNNFDDKLNKIKSKIITNVDVVNNFVDPKIIEQEKQRLEEERIKQEKIIDLKKQLAELNGESFVEEESVVSVPGDPDYEEPILLAPSKPIGKPINKIREEVIEEKLKGITKFDKMGRPNQWYVRKKKALTEEEIDAAVHKKIYGK